MFKMLKGETIVDVQKRFTHIVYHLINLGKIFERDELNIKILKCLDRSWQPKVTAISESKDLTTLTTTSLFGKLREHELEMNMMNDQEHEEKHVKSIALKAAGNRDCQESSKDNDEETLNLLTRKFNKFLKKRNNKNKSSNRYNNKKFNDFNANNYSYFGCGRAISKLIIPTMKARREEQARNLRRRAKLKKTYIAWQDNDVSFSSSSSNGDK